MTKKKCKYEKLTDFITYQILDNTIYLFNKNNDITFDEWKIAYKKICTIIDDNDISYINFSTKKMEERKEFYQELGFTLSYYDVNKLYSLYKDVEDKKLYRCYGIMTKKDFLDWNHVEDKNDDVNLIKVVNSDSGFISNLLLLFGGILLLCYFCVQGAIYLVR